MASPQTTDDVASPPVVTCVDLARVAAGNGNGNGFGKIKRIAVMTAGGDCPGLNATIRAISFDAFGNGIDVLGVEDGILGLIEDRIKPIRMEDVRAVSTTVSFVCMQASTTFNAKHDDTSLSCPFCMQLRAPLRAAQPSTLTQCHTTANTH